MARTVRIAVSVFFATLAVSLLLLWPLTHSKPFAITLGGSTSVEKREFRIGDGYIGTVKTTRWRYPARLSPRPVWKTTDAVVRAGVPLWFCAAVSLTFGAVLWFPQPTYRYSLRTLLIAMTLIALVLGLGVWLET